MHPFRSATELTRDLREKKISSRELTDLYIRRIEKYDPGINAVVVHDFEHAREAAERADAALARGELAGPLHGLPMTVKEAYDLEGTPTTWGAPAFARNVAASDAEVVRRLKLAGAHFLGKTNVPLNLGDLQTYNEIYGTTHNPWNPERVPGGSSGGSAAALAAGLTALESGSDIGGSIRNPAHFCGVYGHKPTYGIVPQQGHALPGTTADPDLGVVGPMARSADDLALSLDVVAGADPFHAAGWKLALPRATKASLAEYRVAIWPSDARAPVSVEVADRAQDLGDRLARLGASVSDTARPELDPGASHNVYLKLLNSELSAGIPDEAFEKMLRETATLDPDDGSPRTRALRGTVLHHREWVRLNHERARLRNTWRAFFREVDILLCPISPVPAFEHDHSPFQSRTLRVDDADRHYGEQLFWAGLATVSYLPSSVFPTGPSREGLPIGLQAVGAEFHDRICIDFVRLVAEQIGGFTPPPGYED